MAWTGDSFTFTFTFTLSTKVKRHMFMKILWYFLFVFDRASSV